MVTELPYLDLRSPDFSTKSDAVLAARELSWCAKTPFGYAVLRHREAGTLLRDKRLRQGSYAWPDKVGIAGSFAEFWKRSIISEEGRPHRALRDLAVPALEPEYIESLKPAFTRIASTITDEIVERGRCEFVSEFSHKFSGQAICTLLGVPLEEFDFVASNASDLGLAMGMEARRYETRFNLACERLMDFSDALVTRARTGSDTHSYVARLVSRFDELGFDDQQLLRDLIVISIFGGVDTTRSQLGFAVALFIAHAEQWRALRNDHSLAANAVEEIIRAWPTTTWATREAVEDFVHQDVEIKTGDTLHFLVHACGLDPLITQDPEFNITKRRKSHFGFGGGAHHCLGHMVARTDIACALVELAKKVESFEYDGEPEFMPDSGNTSPIHLPVRLTSHIRRY